MHTGMRDTARKPGFSDKWTVRALLLAATATMVWSGCLPAVASATKESAPDRLRGGQVVPAGYTYPSVDSFTVLSWNVEHFVDAYDDPYIDHPREDEPSPETTRKVEYLTAALRQANADVVVLQEFESSKYLQKLAAEQLAGMGYAFFASAPSDTWYMNVVVMSKYPLGILYAYGNVTTPVVDYTNEEGLSETQNNLNTRMWSLEVFPAEDYAFVLTGLHLKAGRSERDRAMRLGQIDFLKYQFERFLSLNPAQNLLVVGDLNSVPGSAEITSLLGNPANPWALYDPLPADLLTHPSDAPSRRLDHVLFNANMRNEYRPGSARVPDVLDAERRRGLSDHLPLISTFSRTDR